jgi:hypothetical protein
MVLPAQGLKYHLEFTVGFWKNLYTTDTRSEVPIWAYCWSFENQR